MVTFKIYFQWEIWWLVDIGVLHDHILFSYLFLRLDLKYPYIFELEAILLEDGKLGALDKLLEFLKLLYIKFTRIMFLVLLLFWPLTRNWYERNINFPHLFVWEFKIAINNFRKIFEQHTKTRKKMWRRGRLIMLDFVRECPISLSLVIRLIPQYSNQIKFVVFIYVFDL